MSTLDWLSGEHVSLLLLAVLPGYWGNYEPKGIPLIKFVHVKRALNKLLNLKFMKGSFKTYLKFTQISFSVNDGAEGQTSSNSKA